MNFFNIKQVAKILNVSYDTALFFLQESGIDYIQIGSEYRVQKKKLKAFLSKNGKIIVQDPNVDYDHCYHMMH